MLNRFILFFILFLLLIINSGYSYVLGFKFPVFVNIEVVLPSIFEFKPISESCLTDVGFISPFKFPKLFLFYKTNTSIYLPKGDFIIFVSSDGYYLPKVYYVNLTNNLFIEDKLEKSDSILRLVKEVKVGYAPKSVEFSPDGRYVFSALLGGDGVEVIDCVNFEKVKRIEFTKEFSEKYGFVEVAFLKKHNKVIVSQMTTDSIHLINYSNLSYESTIKTLGTFPKVVLVDKDERFVFVSNWASKDISIINLEVKKVIRKIPTYGTPRGMAFSPDYKFLYVCLFDDQGVLQKIDLSSFKSSFVDIPKGAKRHIVCDNIRNLFFVSDMARGSVFVISYPEDKVIKEIKVDHKLNTIKLSPNKRFLFVSSRGPNNPKTYLLKGPVYGKVYVIDTYTFEIVDWIWGRNQPTGLDVSPDGKYLAFSDFLDNNIEIYSVQYPPNKTISLSKLCFNRR